MATDKEENTRIAEIAAEITKELIKANPGGIDNAALAKSAFNTLYDAIIAKVGKQNPSRPPRRLFIAITLFIPKRVNSVMVL
ncbi:hypothetical protein [Pectobacterium parmentieri]|uniref:hypothetical protein n=1 Tax=Pectobacterium parmentieri TaxID=1905730 RepID=UPI000EAF3B79|nr:hypothetical protein [Pectobacterium parmentieri]AYH32977.1 hypothetical protein C5E19_15880 [Pectobacterium parmentieri]